MSREVASCRHSRLAGAVGCVGHLEEKTLPSNHHDRVGSDLHPMFVAMLELGQAVRRLDVLEEVLPTPQWWLVAPCGGDHEDEVGDGVLLWSQLVVPSVGAALRDAGLKKPIAGKRPLIPDQHAVRS